MPKVTILAAALALSAGAACAQSADSMGGGAELGPNPNAKSQGSIIGVFSSRVTGNGAVIEGGTMGDGQTMEAGSRADEVQGLLALEGKGRDAVKVTEPTDETE